MARKGRKSNDESSRLVPVAHGCGIDEARRLCDLLEDHEIPAQIPEEDGDVSRTAAGEVPVLVPAELAEEAADIIAERQELEELGLEEDEFEDESDDEEGLTELDEADVFGDENEEEEEEEEESEEGGEPGPDDDDDEDL